VSLIAGSGFVEVEPVALVIAALDPAARLVVHVLDHDSTQLHEAGDDGVRVANLLPQPDVVVNWFWNPNGTSQLLT
jgi:hypothetical protein